LSGLLSAEELGSRLRLAHFDPVHVEPAGYQTWGPAHYRAELQDGHRVSITFYGRDATNAQLLTKVLRYVFYRDSGPALTLRRIEQVEHESSVTQLADRAGVRVPAVVFASTFGPSSDAALITKTPAGSSFSELNADDITDQDLDAVFEQFVVLRHAFIAHGAVSPHTIVLDPGHASVTLVDFGRATSVASDFVLDGDLAGAMASVAAVVGVERTAASVVRMVPRDLLPPVLGHVRRAGLDPGVFLALKGKRAPFDELRTEVAHAADIAVPELVEPRRLSWSQVLVAIGTLVGGWALILVLINASHSAHTIANASWGWVIATFLFCGGSYLAYAFADLGSVPGPLPYGRTLGLEFADAFTVLAGGQAATLATKVRYFQLQGYDTTEAVTSGAVVSAASLLIKGALFLIVLPIAWSSFNFGHRIHQSSHSTALWVVLAVVVIIGAVVAATLAVPRWKQHVAQKLRPKFSQMRASFRTISSSPTQVVQLFGGQLAAQLAVVLALGCALHAFGAYLSVAALVIAVTMAGVLAAASPAGGGMGVAEAGLILALTAGGISKNQATAAVFVQRLFSAYLPPIAGWFTLMWMRRRQYL
jgi:glycosyltransferase 2 family protein